MARLVIFDLDGCISDDAWRFDFVREHEDADERFSTYHDALHLDEPLYEGIRLLNRCVRAGMFPVFVTARPEAHRANTASWLEHHTELKMGRDYLIMMRENGDARPTVEIKRDCISAITNALPNAKIVAAYDDREDVVTMYYAVFDINAFVLDKHGVRDVLGLRSHRMRNFAEPSTASPATERVGEDSARAHRAGDGVARPAPAPDYGATGDLLRAMAETFERKNAQYGSNGVKVGDVMQVLFPNGVTFDSAADHRMAHLFQLVIVKLTRFVNSGMKHVDSIHDAAVYCAMVEAETGHHNIKFDR
jgi:hypothetical protein